MDERLVEFANLLRGNGLRVSLAESMDAFRALDAVGLLERDAVRAALRATLVKRTVDLPAFEQLFDLFFSGLADTIRDVTQATSGALGMDDAEFQAFLEHLQQ